VHADPLPFWLRFPALSPYKEKRPSSRAGRERLERLATPRPDSSLSHHAATSPSLGVADVTESGLQVTTSSAGSGPSFSPKIDTLWEMDWQSQIFQHERASEAEVIRWFNTEEVEGKVKLRGSHKNRAYAALHVCAHKDKACEGDLACRGCRVRLCSDCYLDGQCASRKETFWLMSPWKRQQALEDELDLQSWQARALLRNAKSAVERLYPKPKESRRGNRFVLEEARTPEFSSEQGGGYDTEELKQQMLEHRREMLEQMQSSEAFQRLTMPRESPAFPETPYLPWMKGRSKRLEELVDLNTEDDVEGALHKLKARGKLKQWQVSALLRCATPVFERLQHDSEGRHRRQARSKGKSGA